MYGVQYGLESTAVNNSFHTASNMLFGEAIYCPGVIRTLDHSSLDAAGCSKFHVDIIRRVFSRFPINEYNLSTGWLAPDI